MRDLNEYELLTLIGLAREFVDDAQPDNIGLYCDYCLWSEHDNTEHICLYTEVAGIVASWNEDGLES